MSVQETLSRRSSELANSIFDDLNDRSVGTLGLVGKDKLPHLSAIYYSIDENFVTSFATKKQTQKYQILQNSPQAQVLVFDQENQLTIQVTGEVLEVTDAKLKARIIEEMYMTAAENDLSSPPISKLFAGDYVAFQILPRRITRAFFLRPKRGGYDTFETLNFQGSKN